MEGVADLIRSIGSGAGGSGSVSLAEALHRQARVFDEPLFDNVVAYGWGLGIFVGSWFAAAVAEWAILYLWGINWVRVFRLCRGRNRDDGGSGSDDPLWHNPNDPDASANKEKVLPVAAALLRSTTTTSKFSVSGASQRRLGDVVGTTPQTYKVRSSPPAVPRIADSSSLSHSLTLSLSPSLSLSLSLSLSRS